MSLSKRESSIDHTQFICRLVKELPSGKVTCGSGCLVLRSQGASKPSAYLITTTQAVTTNHPLEHGSITVEFHDGLTFKLELESREASGSPNLIPGRVLKDWEDKEGQVSFLNIPASRFDSRMWLIRKFKPLEKRAIQCSHSSDEALKSSLSQKHISCHVISDDRRDGRFYITEPSYISFDKDTSEFALHSITDGDYVTPFKSIDDFPRDQKLKGAPLLNAERKFVGMLAVASSGEHKVYPVFLPTLTSNSKDDSLGNGKTKSKIETPPDNTTLRPRSDEEDEDNGDSAKPSPPKQCGSEDNGTKTIISERQGSASPPSSPLDGCSSEASRRNHSAEGENQDPRHDRPQCFLPPDYSKRNSSEESMRNGSDEDENQNLEQNNHNSLLPVSNALMKLSKASIRNGTAKDRNQDQQQGEPQGLAEPESGNESSSEKSVCEGSAEDKSKDQQKDDSHNLPQPDNGCERSLQKNRGCHLEPKEDSGATFAGRDHPVDNSRRLLKQDNANSDCSLRGESYSHEGNRKIRNTEEIHFKNTILIPTSSEEDENNDASAKTSPPMECGSECNGAKSITIERQGSVSPSSSPCSSEDCVRSGSAEEQNQDHPQVEPKILLQSDNGNNNSLEESIHHGSDKYENQNQEQNHPNSLLPQNNTCQLSRASTRNDSTDDNNHNQKQGDFQSLSEADSVHENLSEESVCNSSDEESEKQMQGSLHSVSLPSNSKGLEASLGHGCAGKVNRDQHQTNPHKLRQSDDCKEGSFQKNLCNDGELEAKSSGTLGEGDQLLENSPTLLEQDNENSDESLREAFKGDLSSCSESRKSSDFEEHSSLSPDDQDKQEDHPYDLFQPSSTNQSSLQDKSDGSFTSEVSSRDALDPLICLDSDGREGSLEQNFGVEFRSSQIGDSLTSYSDCDYRVDSKGYAANSESSLTGYDEIHQVHKPEISNKPERDPKGSNSFSASDENVVALSGSQLRSRYATQNSFHEPQPRDEDLPFPRAVSDPTPSKSTAVSGQRQREYIISYNPQQQRRERTLQSTSEVSASSSSSHTGEKDMTPRTRHPSTQLKHVTAESLVKEEILAKAIIMDKICLHLDRPCYSKAQPTLLIQSWRHLADYFEVDDDIKKHCESYTNLSPSEALFLHLSVSRPFLTIATLKQYLCDPEVARIDVYNELEKNGDLPDTATVSALCNKHPVTFYYVCLKLDEKHHVKHWFHLGLKIGINGEKLRSFKDPSGFSPSSAVLQKIESVDPELLLSRLQKVLEGLEELKPAICNVLTDLIAADPQSTIQDLLADIDIVEKLTLLLDLEENAWRRVGKLGKMTKLELDSLVPESPPSPTQLVMEHIVAKDPGLTMKSFLEALAHIKRNNVIKELKTFFFAKDIDDILSLAHITQDNITALI